MLDSPIQGKRIAHVSVAHHPHHFRVYHRELKALQKEGAFLTFFTPKAGQEPAETGITFRSFFVPKNKMLRVFSSPFILLSQLLLQGPFDLVHIHSAELLPAGYLLKMLGWKVIYEAHDNLAVQISTKDWIPDDAHPSLLSGIAALELFFAGRLDGIIVVEPSNKTRFPAAKSIVIRNFPKQEEFNSISLEDYEHRPNHLVYTGHISRARGIFDYLNAMAEIPDRYNARLVLAGYFAPPELLEELEQHPGWAKTVFMGYLNREELIGLYQKVKLGLVVLEDNEKYRHSDPVKLFEYMAAGLPFVMNDFPEWESLTDHQSIALSCKAGEPKQLAQQIIRMMDHPDEAAAMGRRGRVLAQERYQWKEQEALFMEWYRSLF